MQRHESYKPSGVKWLGAVPSHWEILALRAVTQLKSDRNRPDLPVLSVYREYGVIRKDSRDDNHNAVSASANVISSASRTLTRGWSWFHLKPAVDNYKLDASVGPPFFELVVGIPEPSGEGPSCESSLNWAAAAFLVCSRVLMRPLASCELWRKR